MVVQAEEVLVVVLDLVLVVIGDEPVGAGLADQDVVARAAAELVITQAAEQPSLGRHVGVDLDRVVAVQAIDDDLAGVRCQNGKVERAVGAALGTPLGPNDKAPTCGYEQPNCRLRLAPRKKHGPVLVDQNRIDSHHRIHNGGIDMRWTGPLFKFSSKSPPRVASGDA